MAPKTMCVAVMELEEYDAFNGVVVGIMKRGGLE